MSSDISIHWFRRDLRINDNAALYHALRSGNAVQCVFIFDKNILSRLKQNAVDRRVIFIHQQLHKLNAELERLGSALHVYYDTPDNAWNEILNDYNVKAVFTNRDYEPSAIERDERINQFLSAKGISFHTFKDQVIFEKDEVLKDDGKPYTIFTPYKNKYRSRLTPFFLSSYPNNKYFGNFNQRSSASIPTIEEIGFVNEDLHFPPLSLSKELLIKYANQRNFPAVPGTSRLSVHMRFGTVSVRELFRYADAYSELWANELIWRDFYMYILSHFPLVVKKAFKPDYDRIEWNTNEKEFAAWCEGRTGYPIVDAGMRELNETGFMHNRVRMIVASFLVKHLLIDWRWGEAYFAEKLIDFDLSANNGGWQWASSSGTDAAPYFRIFNPEEQQKKFDPKFQYIRKWVPEFGTEKYPRPIVDHKFARERCLAAFKKALSPQ